MIYELSAGESLDRALKKFARLVAREGILREYRGSRFHVKPSDKLRRKIEGARRRRAKAARNLARRERSA